MAKIKLHPSVTEERVIAAVKEETFGLENPGICVACGADHDECEPDARRYECYECGEETVFGAAELLLRGWFYRQPTPEGERQGEV